MADTMDDKNVVADDKTPRFGADVALGIDEAAAIPKGTLDPVYEAKARVLNKAIQDIGMGWVRRSSHRPTSHLAADTLAVSMAVVRRCRLRLGQRQPLVSRPDSISAIGKTETDWNRPIVTSLIRMRALGSFKGPN